MLSCRLKDKNDRAIKRKPPAVARGFLWKYGPWDLRSLSALTLPVAEDWDATERDNDLGFFNFTDEKLAVLYGLFHESLPPVKATVNG